MPDASKSSAHRENRGELRRALKQVLQQVFVGAVLVLGAIPVSSFLMTQLGLETGPWYLIVFAFALTPALLYAGYCHEGRLVTRSLGAVGLSVILISVTWTLAEYFELDKTFLVLSPENRIWQVVVPWLSFMIATYVIYWKKNAGNVPSEREATSE